MNELEKVITGTNDELSDYLSNVTCSEFRKHVQEVIAKYSDKGAIQSAIKNLQQIIEQK